MIDEAKYIKNRLINAKDITKVIRNLEKQNYKIEYREKNSYLNHIEKFYTISKENINVNVCFEDNKSGVYKQNIKYITY